MGQLDLTTRSVELYAIGRSQRRTLLGLHRLDVFGHPGLLCGRGQATSPGMAGPPRQGSIGKIVVAIVGPKNGTGKKAAPMAGREAAGVAVSSTLVP